MREIFSLFLHMSWTGSIVILVVLLLRVALRRVPHSISFALWSIVLFRLLCPVSLTVEHAPISMANPSSQQVAPGMSTLVPPTVSVPAEGFRPSSLPTAGTESPWVWMDALAWIWFAGAVLFLTAILFSICRTKLKLRESIRLRSHVYVSDQFTEPFSFGRNIYLPFNLDPSKQTYILLHEQAHIRRGDPIWKVLSLVALALHWMNPLCWLAYHLAVRDMEMSCDEAVLNKLNHDGRAAYSTLLLNLATGQSIGGTVLPFAEDSPKKRIQNILKWKKPSTRQFLFFTVIATVIMVLLAVNPTGSPTSDASDAPQAPLLVCLRTGEILDADGENLPSLHVMESLFHEEFRNPILAEQPPIDIVWKLSVKMTCPISLDEETITLQCGLLAPNVVQVQGEEADASPLVIQSEGLYELVQHAQDPDFNLEKVPYIDDPDAYGRYHPIVVAFLARDLGKNGIHTQSTLTQFLAVRTAPHPLDVKVYYVGYYAVADPLEKTAELLSGDVKVDHSGRIYELEPRQSLVTVEDVPIGFVSEDWLRSNDLNYDTHEALIDAVLEEGLSVSSLRS